MGQAVLAALCLHPCLCHCRGQPPTQRAGCWPPTCLCLTAACSVVSASCGHKPYSGCLLRTQPGAARPSCAHKHRRPTCGCGSWLGTGVESHYQERLQQRRRADPTCSQARSGGHFQAGHAESFCLVRRYGAGTKSLGFKGSRARSKETLGPPGSKVSRPKLAPATENSQ